MVELGRGWREARAKRWGAAVTALTVALACTAAPPELVPEPEELVPTEWADPERRLSELLGRGAHPGELEVVERLEVEVLVERLLTPPATAPVPGDSWKVVYIDLPAVDVILGELLTTTLPTGPRTLWFRWIYRADPGVPTPCDGLRVQGLPACEVSGHHLTVWAGRVELMVVADDEAWRQPGALESLVGMFRLDALAAL